jgi:hypothetical protein
MKSYTLGDAPEKKNEAFEALQDVVSQGTFTEAEAIEILQNVLSYSDRQAKQAFDGLLATDSIKEA